MGTMHNRDCRESTEIHGAILFEEYSIDAKTGIRYNRQCTHSR